MRHDKQTCAGLRRSFAAGHARRISCVPEPVRIRHNAPPWSSGPGTDPAFSRPSEDTVDRQCSPITLVAMEAGSEWPTWLDSQTDDDVVVIAETPSTKLTERVLHRLSTFEQSGSQAALAVIAVAERRFDDETMAARRRVGQALCAHLARAGAGSVLLTCSDRASAGHRAALLELAAAILRDGGRPIPATIGVRFHAKSHRRVESRRSRLSTRAA